MLSGLSEEAVSGVGGELALEERLLSALCDSWRTLRLNAFDRKERRGSEGRKERLLMGFGKLRLTARN
jgi:hypothetical protein